MTLPLSPANLALVVAIFDRLTVLGGRPVLVGGMVPPLLAEVLAPDDDRPLPPRTTRDCDVAFAIDGDADRYEAYRACLRDLGLVPRPQFGWQRDDLLVDALPVPVGIERADARAVAFASKFIERDQASFYRGYELALERPVRVAVALADGTNRAVAIAGVTAMLAMKLQAYEDRPYDRKKDAHDVVWLARNLTPEIIAADLRACRGSHAALVDEIIARLRRDFGDLWARGVGAYFDEAYRGRTSYDEGQRRQTAADAVAAVLQTYLG